MIPFWLIYSYWVFVMTILWSFGIITWSPLISTIFAFVGSSFPVLFTRQFTQANIFIILTHLIPIWILRKTRIDIVPNLLVFLIYNLVLVAYGTDYIKVYKYIFTHVPTTIQGYLCQRLIIPCDRS
jgi:hypothetical protein